MVFSFFRDRRGVSEIISSLLIVLIVTIAGVGLYAYSLSAFSISSSSFQLQTGKNEELARERFLIIAVWWDTASQLNLTVLNHGRIELAIDAVYINGTSVSISSGKGVIARTGKLVSIKFFSPLPIQDGHTYEFVAVSERGSRNVFHWKA